MALFSESVPDPGLLCGLWQRVDSLCEGGLWYKERADPGKLTTSISKLVTAPSKAPEVPFALDLPSL